MPRRGNAPAKKSIGIMLFLCLGVRLPCIREYDISTVFDIAQKDEDGGDTLLTVQVRVRSTAIFESKLVFINAVDMCILFDAARTLSPEKEIFAVRFWEHGEAREASLDALGHCIVPVSQCPGPRR